MKRAVLVLLGILIGVVLVAAIFVVGGDGSEDAQTEAGPLLCVDLAGDASDRSDADDLRRLATAAVAEAIAALSTHRYWPSTPDLSPAAALAAIDPDCPGQPQMDCPEDPRLFVVRCIGSLVSEPSPYLLFVFVASDADLQRVVGALTERRSVLEYTCVGDSCQEETSTTWVRETELEDSEAIYALVGEGIGILEPRD